MHVLKVLFKIAWVMLASIFFLSFFFFLHWYLPSMKSFLKTNAIPFPCVNQETNLNFFSPPAVSPCWSTSKQRYKKENCITFFPEDESIGWFTWMSPACSGCTVYFTIQAKELHMWMLSLGSTSRCFLCLAAWILQMQSVCEQVQNNIYYL